MWHQLVLTSREVAAGEEMRLQNLFANEFIRLGGPVDLAMFSHWSEDMENVILSFTPKIEDYPVLIRILGARAGDRPPVTAALSVGSQDALGRLRDGTW